MEVKTVMFFANGNTAVFDQNGKQVPKFQKAWHFKFLEWMQSNGWKGKFDEIEIRLPDGATAKPFITSEGRWNWKVKR